MCIKLNDEASIVEAVRQGLKDNDGYCPCRVKRTSETKCMCKEFREQKSGICHCGLYIKVDDK